MDANLPKGHISADTSWDLADVALALNLTEEEVFLKPMDEIEGVIAALRMQGLIGLASSIDSANEAAYDSWVAGGGLKTGSPPVKKYGA